LAAGALLISSAVETGPPREDKAYLVANHGFCCAQLFIPQSSFSMLRGSLALLAVSLAIGGAASQKITDDTYFYGQSPPVYPARAITLSPLSGVHSLIPPA
jgi:hypothetical protein